MNTSDEIVLKALKPFMSDDGYAYVVEKTTEAGGIRKLTDTTAKMQLELAKRGFGGNRSAAASYAANVRWGGSGAKIGGGNESFGVSVNGSYTPVDFTVTETAAANVKFGDTILNAHGQPAWVTGSTIHPSPAGYDHIISSTPVSYTTGRNGQLQHALPPNFHASSHPSDNLVVPAGTLGPKVKVLSAVGVGKANGSTKGRIDASRKVDPAKITAADHAFINAGSDGPEKVRRRTIIIDRYASQGKDVSVPSDSGPKGGAQWLGTSSQ